MKGEQKGEQNKPAEGKIKVQKKVPKRNEKRANTWYKKNGQKSWRNQQRAIQQEISYVFPKCSKQGNIHKTRRKRYEYGGRKNTHLKQTKSEWEGEKKSQTEGKKVEIHRPPPMFDGYFLCELVSRAVALLACGTEVAEY